MLINDNHVFLPIQILQDFGPLCKCLLCQCLKNIYFSVKKVCAQWSQCPGTPSTSLGNSLTLSILGQSKTVVMGVVVERDNQKA